MARGGAPKQPPLPAGPPPPAPVDASTAAAFENYGYGPRHPLNQQNQQSVAAQAALSTLAAGAQYYQQAAFQAAGPSTYGATPTAAVQAAAPTIYGVQANGYSQGAASPQQLGPPTKRARYDQPALVGPQQPMGGSASPTSYAGYPNAMGSAYGSPRQMQQFDDLPLGMPPPIPQSRGGNYGMPHSPSMQGAGPGYRGGRGGFHGPPSGPSFRGGGPPSNGGYRNGPPPPPMGNANGYRGGPGPMRGGGPGPAGPAGYGPGPRQPPFNQRNGPPRGYAGAPRNGPPQSRNGPASYGYGPPGAGRGRSWTVKSSGDANRTRAIDPKRAAEEKRRARTDFGITAFEISALDFSWSSKPSQSASDTANAVNGEAHHDRTADEAAAVETEATPDAQPETTDEPRADPTAATETDEPMQTEQSDDADSARPVDAQAEPAEAEPKSEPFNAEAELATAEAEIAADTAHDNPQDTSLDGEALPDTLDGEALPNTPPPDEAASQDAVPISPAVAIRRPATSAPPPKPLTPAPIKKSEVRIYFMTGPSPIVAATSAPLRRKRSRSSASASVDTPASATSENVTAPEAEADMPMDIEASSDAGKEAPEAPVAAAATAETAKDSEPSAPAASSDERLTIMFDNHAYRLNIDSTVVKQLRLHRAELRLEVELQIESAGEDELRPCRGVLIEQLDLETGRYSPVTRNDLVVRTSEGSNMLRSLPPLHRLLDRSQDAGPVTLTIALEKAAPLNVSKWPVDGQVDTWITSHAAVTGGSPSTWLGKIVVVDPEETPTFQHVLDTWLESSTTGSYNERKAFVEARLGSTEIRMELLLRLVRGDLLDGQPGFPPSQPQSSTVAAQAAQLDAPYRSHQTPISLATFSLFRLACEMAQQAGHKREVVDQRVGEILRMLPYNLLFRALDSLLQQAQVEDLPS